MHHAIMRGKEGDEAGEREWHDSPNLSYVFSVNPETLSVNLNLL